MPSRRRCSWLRRESPQILHLKSQVLRVARARLEIEVFVEPILRGLAGSAMRIDGDHGARMGEMHRTKPERATQIRW